MVVQLNVYVYNVLYYLDVLENYTLFYDKINKCIYQSNCWMADFSLFISKKRKAEAGERGIRLTLVWQIPYEEQGWGSRVRLATRGELLSRRTCVDSKPFARLSSEFEYKPSLIVSGLRCRSQSMPLVQTWCSHKWALIGFVLGGLLCHTQSANLGTFSSRRTTQ